MRAPTYHIVKGVCASLCVAQCSLELELEGRCLMLCISKYSIANRMQLDTASELVIPDASKHESASSLLIQ